MPDLNIEWDQQAINMLMATPEGNAYLKKIGQQVRDRARSNASFSKNTDAIEAIEPVHDADGSHIDIGYLRNKPGFYLWWVEVGHQTVAARPHLRPALNP